MEEMDKSTKRSETQDEPDKKKHKTSTDSIRETSYEIDPSYKFSEIKLEKPLKPLHYIPVYFLRTHSKNNDPADVQTQIWQCGFEPHLEKDNGYTDIVATCGGTSVCFIDVKTGEVQLKYNRNTKAASTENLYALAWSSLPLDEFGMKKINILAAGGGSRSTVIIMHPKAGCCYQLFRTVTGFKSLKAAPAVCSLMFHPKKSSWLICGHNDGHIQIWDVGVPPLPSYDVTPVHLMNLPNKGGDVYNLAYSHSHDMLLAGCDQGLFGWTFDMTKLKKGECLECTEFLLPSMNDDVNVVDSICLVRDDKVAAKCALHGFIYIFSLSEVLNGGVAEISQNLKTNNREARLTNKSLVKLTWSDSDNFYMNMGVDAKSCTLVCGDDKGVLWVFDLFSYISGEIKSPLNGGKPLKFPIDPDLKLEWPELEDAEVEKARKLRLDSYDIVIDNCTVSEGGHHIVAVTSNNMVCIWHREEDSDEE